MICENCGFTFDEPLRTKVPAEIPIYDEKILVNKIAYVCPLCGEIRDVESSPVDNFKTARILYRIKKRLLRGRDIEFIRKLVGTKEMVEITGIDEDTIDDFKDELFGENVQTFAQDEKIRECLKFI